MAGVDANDAHGFLRARRAPSAVRAGQWRIRRGSDHNGAGQRVSARDPQLRKWIRGARLPQVLKGEEQRDSNTKVEKPLHLDLELLVGMIRPPV
jgi:hypothetical protein